MTHDSVVHLVDDDEGVRHALAFLLSAAGFAVRVYASGQAFLDSLASAQAGCVVTDVRMPGLDGLELQKALAARAPHLPVIVMTGHADVKLAVAAMKGGAVDFIEKPFDDEILLAAIRAALDRGAKTTGRAAAVESIEARLKTLSAREAEVLAGLVAGLPNKTIAYDLNISARTVEVHRANVMAKMGAGSLSDLVRMVFTVQGA